MIHKMLFEEFQDDCNFGYQNGFCISVVSIASSNLLFFSTYGLGDAVHDGHLGYQNGMIVAIHNLHVTPMLHIASAQSK